MESATTLIESFVSALATGSVEIYSEISLQHELGFFLRAQLRVHNVQFERNVRDFFERADFVKKEIDLAVLSLERGEPVWAVELKYPRNGQHPEQMFKFCEDVRFAEQLKTAGFKGATAVIFAEDRLFYEGPGSGIYSYFRTGATLHGLIRKPTGAKDKEITINGSYRIEWKPVKGELKYALVEAAV